MSCRVAAVSAVLLLVQVGKGKCHIVDTFWQTETGGHVMLPLANITPTKPGSCSFPFFGIEVNVDVCLGYKVWFIFGDG